MYQYLLGKVSTLNIPSVKTNKNLYQYLLGKVSTLLNLLNRLLKKVSISIR